MSIDPENSPRDEKEAQARAHDAFLEFADAIEKHAKVTELTFNDGLTWWERAVLLHKTT